MTEVTKAGLGRRLGAAVTAFFEEGRRFRDALTAWPGEIGPLLAADLNVPAERVTRFLVEHVRKFLVGLGEPDGATLRGDADHR
jgi:hypothetical protein